MTNTIQLLALDLDGTLLNDQHELSERTEKALKAAMAQGVQVVLATGKTRNSATGLIARLGCDTPGIYLQGLATYNGDGSLRYQSTLDPVIARQVITFAEDRGFSVVAYSGTRILVRSLSKGTEVLQKYGEPAPEVVGPLQNLLDSTPINKLMAIKMGDHRAVTALRWQLGMQLDGAARLVQAGIPDMLEILPPGASKGTALKTLLHELNIPAANVLAAGDGENDIEMVKLAGVGVAVGNASPELKAAADHVVASNNEDGVAEAIERFVLPPAPTTAEASEEGKPEPAVESENKDKDEL